MSLLDMTTAKALGKISFVPVNFPTRTESGGHVEYVLDICRFSDVASSGAGALVFSTMPVLADDILSRSVSQRIGRHNYSQLLCCASAPV